MFEHHIQEERRANPSTAEDIRLSRLLSALMDRVECAMLACGPRGELLHANLSARRELKEGALRVVDGLVCSARRYADAWSAALHGATTLHRSSLVELSEGLGRVFVTVSPAMDEEDAIAVVMIGRRSLCSSLGLEMLAASCGLTHAERRVLRALIDNCTAREIAGTHGVAVTTIRTQILAIREKLGVRSIEALLLRAAEVPLIMARH